MNGSEIELAGKRKANGPTKDVLMKSPLDMGPEDFGASKGEMLTTELEKREQDRNAISCRSDFLKWLYNTLEEPTHTLLGTLFMQFIMLLIVTSILVICLRSTPDLEDNYVLYMISYVINVTFMFEVVLRIISRLTMPHELFGDWLLWVDILSLMPFIIETLASGPSLGLLRSLRILRLLKIGRYYSGMYILVEAITISLHALMVPMVFLVILSLFWATMLYYVEVNEASGFYSIPQSIWFVMVTMTSVGYGDIVPISTMGKMLTTITMLCGIFFLAMPLSVIGTNFSSVWLHKEKTLLINRIKTTIKQAGLQELDVIAFFNEFDDDKSGTIDYGEFKLIVERFDLKDLTPKQLRRLFNFFDEDETGEISIFEFATAVYPDIQDTLEEQLLKGKDDASEASSVDEEKDSSSLDVMSNKNNVDEKEIQKLFVMDLSKRVTDVGDRLQSLELSLFSSAKSLAASRDIIARKIKSLQATLKIVKTLKASGTPLSFRNQYKEERSKIKAERTKAERSKAERTKEKASKEELAMDVLGDLAAAAIILVNSDVDVDEDEKGVRRREERRRKRAQKKKRRSKLEDYERALRREGKGQKERPTKAKRETGASSGSGGRSTKLLKQFGSRSPKGGSA